MVNVAYTACQGDGGQTLAAVERAACNAVNTLFDHHGGDLIEVVVPGGRHGRQFVNVHFHLYEAAHPALTADGQGAVVGQDPFGVVAAGAGGYLFDGDQFGTQEIVVTISFNVDSVPLLLGSVEFHGLQLAAEWEIGIADFLQSTGQCDGTQILQTIESIIADGGDTLFYHDSGDLVLNGIVAAPGRLDPLAGLFVIIAVVIHCSAAGDGEDVIVHRPGNIVAAHAGLGLEDASAVLEPAAHRLRGGIGQLFGSVVAAPLDAAAALQTQNLIPGFVAHRPAGGVNRGAAGYGADAFGLAELFGIQGRILGNGLCLGIDGSDGEPLLITGEAVILGVEVAPGAPCGSDLEARDLCGLCLGSCVAKGIIANEADRVGNGDGGQLGAIQENTCSNIPRTASQRDLGQSGAVLENTGVESFNIARNGDLGQTGAASEGSFANLGDAAQEVERGQAGAVFKGSSANVADGAAQGDRGQLGAVVESTVANEDDAIFNHHTGDLIEMILPGGIQKLVVVCAGSFDVAVHLTLTADGQRAVLGERPADIITAGAGNGGGGRAVVLCGKVQVLTDEGYALTAARQHIFAAVVGRANHKQAPILADGAAVAVGHVHQVVLTLEGHHVPHVGPRAGAAGHGALGADAGQAAQVAQVLERLGVALADHIGAAVAVKDVDQLPRCAIGGIGVIHGGLVVAHRVADVVFIRQELFVVGLGGVGIHNSLCRRFGSLHLGNIRGDGVIPRTAVAANRKGELQIGDLHGDAGAVAVAAVAHGIAHLDTRDLVVPVQVKGAVGHQGGHQLVRIEMSFK